VPTTKGAAHVNDRFAERMGDRKVREDTRIVAGLGGIYCAGTHRDREQPPLVSDGAALGVYGRRVPRLCDECAEHIRYAEKRRAYCPKDPKPFCAHCDTHCYSATEAEWQRQMMRYAGPRSLWHGYAIPGIKHALEARKWKREMARRATQAPRPDRTDDHAAD
jgi:hypothetical protein